MVAKDEYVVYCLGIIERKGSMAMRHLSDLYLFVLHSLQTTRSGGFFRTTTKNSGGKQPEKKTSKLSTLRSHAYYHSAGYTLAKR
jgi:hypothetical protein